MGTTALAAPPARGWALPAALAGAVAALLFSTGVWMLAPQWLEDPVQVALVILVAAVPLVLGTLVARSAPRSAVGPLLASAGLALCLTNLVRPEALGPFAGSWMLLYLPFAILLLIVPAGRFASHRWARLGLAVVTVVVLVNGLAIVQWAAPAIAEGVSVPALLLLPVFLVLLVACAAAPVVRFREAGEAERTRLRWIFLAGMSLPLTLLLCWASYLVLGTPELVGFGLTLLYLTIPAGIAVAVLRPGLFDIDRATVATVTAAVLATGILVVLSAACAVVGVSLARWSPLASVVVLAALTAGAAVLFPVLQRSLDRLLYPERGRAVAALRRLSLRVELGEVRPTEVEGVLREALRDPGLRVAYRGADGRMLLLDGSAAAPTEATAFVAARGEDAGAIIPSPDRVKRPTAGVVRAAAPLVEAIRTEAVLAAARSEVEASRERLLRAGYEERRRLERDLHDGAQQRLVALGMRLRVLQRTAPRDQSLDAELDAAVAELGTAVAELRRIAHGVRPSALDDGLGAALADLTRIAPDLVELQLEAPPLPDAVATTAYYVASEALANALRHAGATRIRIAVSEQGGLLRVRVDDDGKGGACLTPTGGLTGLADRVAALSGELAVDSRPGAGTTVEARLPCAL